MKPIAILLAASLLASHLRAQNRSDGKFTISGYFQDLSSSEKLIGANVIDLKTGKGTVSNTYGFYSLTLPSDTVELNYSYIGFQAVPKKFFLRRDTVINVSLDGSIELTQVEVTADKGDRVEDRSQMSRMEIPVAQIKKAPALLGEVDVLKTLQLLPGVQSGGEGQNGLYVRGGSPDQNLILLDGVPIYNASHVAGIFSVFNADAIKNVSLTKGGFPARYGGRLSSILEINLKDGNMQEFHGEGSIGLITSKLTLETPIIKDRSSLLISGRRTYLDLLVRPIAKAAAKMEDIEFKPKLHFYDFNMKYNHLIDDKNRLYLSAYFGRDAFATSIKEDDREIEGGLDWGNVITSLRWNWQLNSKLFSNVTAIFSDYDFSAKAAFTERDPSQEPISYASAYLSGIQDVGLKWDFDFIPNPDHYVKFGAGVTHHTYEPGALSFKLSDEDVNLDTIIGSQDAKSVELYTYIEDDFTVGRFKSNIGLHASGFFTEGKWYSSLQPRISTRYLLSRGWALKASFSTMVQYINLLTSEALSLPTDLWVPSTKKVLPQSSWQAAMGAAKTFGGQFEFSIEAYYKAMNNVISFKPGASFLFGFENDWQEKITQGKGNAYGLELFLQKKSGRTTGWIGYTLSWNNREFDIINSGRRFSYRYDRRHDISVVLAHDFSKRISGSTSWVYGTGNAVTLPIAQYAAYNLDDYGLSNGYNGFTTNVETLGDKNAFRMTSFHRLDFNISFRKKKKRHERTWSFGAYNAYRHKNPYFVYSGTKTEIVDGVEVNNRAYKEVSLIPFVLPYFSYGFKF